MDADRRHKIPVREGQFITHSNSTSQGIIMLILLAPIPTGHLKGHLTPEHVIDFIIGEEF